MDCLSSKENFSYWPFLSAEIQERESLASLNYKEEDNNEGNTYAVGKEVLGEKKIEISSPPSQSSLNQLEHESYFTGKESDCKREISEAKNELKKRKVTPLGPINIKESPASSSSFSGSSNSSESQEMGYGILVDEEWTYSGGILEALPHGLGMVLVNDNSSYFGEFDRGKRTGKGVLNSSNGTIYDGFVDDGLPDGIGILKNADGVLFEGNFKQGLLHGKVTVTYPGNLSFTGIYTLGTPPDKGEIVFLNEALEGQKYYGECCDMTPHGWGSLEYTKDGFTNMLYGKFVYGKCQGQATLRRSDGLVRMGKCVDGHFVGKVMDKFPGQAPVETQLAPLNDA